TASSNSDARSGSSSASSARPSRSPASASRRVNPSRRRDSRVCSAPTLAALSGSSQKPGAPISVSSALRRSRTPAGSQGVREQGQLLTDGGQALRGGLISAGHVAKMRLAGTATDMAPTLLDRLDASLGDGIEAAVIRHHYRRLKRHGQLGVLAPAS